MKLYILAAFCHQLLKFYYQVTNNQVHRTLYTIWLIIAWLRFKEKRCIETKMHRLENFSKFWSTSCPDTSPTEFSLLVQEERFTINFQDCGHGGHLGFSIWPFLAIFHLQVTLILPTKFWVSWPFHSGEVQNTFSRWQPLWPSQISYPLRKHAYSNIQKSSPPKTENFQIKHSNIFHISAQNEPF